MPVHHLAVASQKCCSAESTDSTWTHSSLSSVNRGKNILHAGGAIAAADEIKQPPLKVQEDTKYVHMIPGIQNNLLSTNRFAKAKYMMIFDKEEVNIYNATKN